MVIILFVFAFSLLQALLPQYSLEKYFLRIQSAYTEFIYSEGTAFVRFVKTIKIWEIVIRNIGILLFGSYFTTDGRYVFDYIALDLGIIATIALYGIIFTLTILLSVFKIYMEKYTSNYSIILRAFILASIPAIIFNYELFGYFLNNILLLYGLVIADSVAKPI